MSISRGEVECTVTTAKAVDDATKKEIEQSLNGFVKGLDDFGNDFQLILTRILPKFRPKTVADNESEPGYIGRYARGLRGRALHRYVDQK